MHGIFTVKSVMVRLRTKLIVDMIVASSGWNSRLGEHGVVQKGGVMGEEDKYFSKSITSTFLLANI